MLPQTRQPSDDAITNLVSKVISHLFHHRYQQQTIKYERNHIVKLLNKIGTHDDMIEDMKFNWGDALLSLSAQHDCMHNMGVRGNKIAQQNKQAIISSATVLGEDNNIMNRGFIRDMCPHSSKRGANNFIDKCVDIRNKFDTGECKILCENKGIQSRNQSSVECQDRMIDHWIQNTDPSPSPHDTIRQRDKYGNLVRKNPERDENNKIRHETMQKRFYVKTNDVMYEDWKCECKDFLTQLLAQGKKIPTKGTYVKYKPHYIKQLQTVLKQMICDNCTKFGFQYKAIIQFLSKRHKCGTQSCNNYRLPMGDSCTCPSCSNCLTSELSNMTPYDLLDFVLCNSYGFDHFITCASGNCENMECNTGKFYQLLYFGDGCETFQPILHCDTEVKFEIIDSYKVNDKKYKCLSYDTKSYIDYRDMFIDTLREYNNHQFIKRKQYYDRKMLFSIGVNNIHLFPTDWLFTTIDFISNWQIKSSIITSGMGTNLGSISHLIIYERRIVNSEFQEMAYNFFSDYVRHGWFSAIPAISFYMRRRQQQLSEQNVDLKLFNLGSDRCPKDFWCSPSHVYLADIVGQTGVPILANTTAAGHSKTYHDQIGGTTQSHMDKCRANGSFQIKSGESNSVQAVTFLKRTFKRSQNGSLKRYFYNIPPHMIYTKESPIDRLNIDGNGIKSHHSVYIEQNRFRYRTVSCHCTICINNSYKRACNNNVYAGKWSSHQSVPVHLKWNALLKSVLNNNNNSNHSNNS